MSIWAALCLVTLAIACGQVIRAEENLVRNPDFEDSLATTWYCGMCEAERSIDAYSGVYSARVFNRTDKTEGLKQAVKGIKKNTRYFLEGRIKLLNQIDVHHRVEMFATVRGSASERTLVAATYYMWTEDEWIYVAGDFKTKSDTRDVLIILSVSDTPEVEYLVDTFSLKRILPNPNWRADADARIEKHRKSSVQVKVNLGAHQDPSNLILKIHQTQQAFGFGGGLNALLMTDKDEVSQRYQQYVYSMFNWAVMTNEMKWRMMEVKEGSPHFDLVDETIEALNANGIHNIRGHCLAWAKERKIIRWLKNKSPSAVLTSVRRRVRYMTERYRGKVAHWDVDNEMLRGDWYERKTGSHQFVDGMFHQARLHDDQAILMTNEYDILSAGTFTSAYMRRVHRMMANGVPIGAIGIQNHMHLIPDIHLMKHRLDMMASLGLPIWITEMDVQQNKVQTRAQIFKDTFHLLFSHPAVDGIMVWGFWNGTPHGNVQTSLVDGDDFVENEAGQIVRELMQVKWRTSLEHSLSSRLSKDFRGFHGSYDVTIQDGDRVLWNSSFELKKDNDYTLNIDLTNAISAVDEHDVDHAGLPIDTQVI